MKLFPFNFTKIKSSAVEVNNLHFQIMNFTIIHLTTDQQRLSQAITSHHFYLFTIISILYEGQAE
jgi:hypothetical protein